MSNTIVVGQRILVPKNLIPKKAIEKRYNVVIFNETACKRCDNNVDRPNSLCDNCPAFIANYKLWKETDSHWSLPQGDWHGLSRILDKKGIKYTIKDKLPNVPFSVDLQWTGSLFGKDFLDENGIPRANQKRAAKTWLKHKAGILQAPPRSGKCVTGDTVINTNKGLMRFDELIKKTGYKKVTNLSIMTPFGTRSVSHTYKARNCETITVKTNHGVEITGTLEHPLLVLTPKLDLVWRRLDDINVGDFVVAGTKRSEYIWPTEDSCSKDIARLLGYMVANGSDNRFHSFDNEVCNTFVGICRNLGLGYRKMFSTKQDTLGKLCGIRVRGIKRLLATYGYDIHVRSSKKEIPMAVRQSTKDIMTAFLSAYFECDSGINGPNINLVTASKDLYQQVSMVLTYGYGLYLRGEKHKKSAHNSRNPVRRMYYEIVLSGYNAYRFTELFPDAKVTKYKDRFNQVESSQANSLNVIPYIKEYIRDLWQSRRTLTNGRVTLNDGSTAILGNPMPDSWRGGHLRKKSVRVDWKSILEKIRSVSPEAYRKVKRIVFNDLHFQQIESVKYTGKKTVYDVTVPKGHCFIGNGIVNHNTPLSVYLACKLGQKTIIFAHQYELLKQFRHEIYRNTNIKSLEKQEKRPLVLLVKTIAQLKQAHKYDIILMSYKKLIYDATRIAKYLNGNFGTLIVDECHNSAAVNYLRVVSLLNVRYRLPLSATPARKDNRHKLIYRIMGSVSTVIESTSLIPRIELFQSQSAPQRAYKVWHFAERWAALDKTRNGEIVEQTFKDLTSGHEVILIPVNSLAHQKLLVDWINTTAKKRNDKYGENWPKDLALAFNGQGGTQSELRRKILQKVDEPGPTVLVAIRKLIREGVNLLRPSALYVVVPMSSSGDKEIGAPMFYQMSMRVCTPFKKAAPVVRIWIDPTIRMFLSAFKGLFWNELWHNRYNGKTGRYYVHNSLVDIVKGLDAKKSMPTARLSNKRGWI